MFFTHKLRLVRNSRLSHAMNCLDLKSDRDINHMKMVELIRRPTVHWPTHASWPTKLSNSSVLPFCGRSRSPKSRLHNTIFIGPTHVKASGPCHTPTSPPHRVIYVTLSIHSLVFCLPCHCGLFIYFFNLLLMCVVRLWLSLVSMFWEELHNSKWK